MVLDRNQETLSVGGTALPSVLKGATSSRREIIQMEVQEGIKDIIKGKYACEIYTLTI